jgi:hypothetical protein
MQIGKLETHSANAALKQDTLALLVLKEQTLLASKQNTAKAPLSSPQPLLQVVRSPLYHLM